jgi:hypothetical protein
VPTQTWMAGTSPAMTEYPLMDQPL